MEKLQNRGANLRKAKVAKNDEFYTQLTDIEKELKHYKEHFKDKVVFLNCDDHEWSNFYKFFSLKFEDYGLKKLISTSYKGDQKSYAVSIENRNGEIVKTKTLLKGNGDFRSEESKAFMEESDIVVTNPPFSLFREFVAQLVEFNKEFLIIGNKNAITYKEIFTLMKDNKAWLGVTSPKEFNIPVKEVDDKLVNHLVKPSTFLVPSVQKFGNIGWFTNLKHNRMPARLILVKDFNEKDYPKYDNYDAINVDKVLDIPDNYYGFIGVPITFMDKYNPEQFEIIGHMATTKLTSYNFGYPYINGKKKYARIIIKRKK